MRVQCNNGNAVFSALVALMYFTYHNIIFWGSGAHIALIEKYELLCLYSSLDVTNHTGDDFTQGEISRIHLVGNF